MRKKLLFLLVLLMTAATGSWAQRLYLDVNGTSATLKYSATASDYDGKPSYSGGWSYIGDVKTTVQTITTDATSCANFSGTAINSLFSDFTALTSADLRGLNTANVTVMNNLFGGCTSLTSVDLSGLNTSKVTNMATLFNMCSSLTSVDLSSWDTSSATSMGSMFSDCSALTSVNLSSFNTSKVTGMGSMFARCSALTSVNLSSFNTSKVTTMSNMFYDCTNLATIYVGNDWSTAAVTSSANMFAFCTKLLNLNSNHATDKTNAHTGEGGYLSTKPYKVTLNDTKDAANWTITPAEATTTGVSKGKTVTLTYTGRMKVKSVTATTDAVPPAPKPIADVNTNDVGKLIGLNGYIYVTKSAATTAGTTAVAVIAYVGSETGDDTYKKGLAIALTDESGTMNWSTAKTTCEGKTAVTNAKWCLPSAYQWRQMCKANGGNDDNCNGLYTTITTHEGTAWQSVKYWTSTEPVSGYKSYFRPTVDGSGGLEIMMEDPNNSYYARACLVF